MQIIICLILCPFNHITNYKPKRNNLKIKSGHKRLMLNSGITLVFRLE